jgi:hypothetical protein
MCEKPNGEAGPVGLFRPQDGDKGLPWFWATPLWWAAELEKTRGPFPTEPVEYPDGRVLRYEATEDTLSEGGTVRAIREALTAHLGMTLWPGQVSIVSAQ